MTHSLFYDGLRYLFPFRLSGDGKPDEKEEDSVSDLITETLLIGEQPWSAKGLDISPFVELVIFPL